MLLVALRQLAATSSRAFVSDAERAGYYVGTFGCLAFAAWLLVSGIRTRRDAKGGPEKP
jgi:hypothetical protein